jgi:uncharacterized RDD family membrane protein YckC
MSDLSPHSLPATVPEPFTLGGYSTTQSLAGLETVGFWPRALARVIDLVLHSCVNMVSGVLVGIMIGIASVLTHQSVAPWVAKIQESRIWTVIAALLGTAAYTMACESISGRTLGKLMLGLVVVQEDGSPCRLKSAVIRNLWYWIDALFFGIVGYMAMQRNSLDQRYGDTSAETIVCKRSSIAPENRRGMGRFLLGFLLGMMFDSAIFMLGILVVMAI